MYTARLMWCQVRQLRWMVLREWSVGRVGQSEWDSEVDTHSSGPAIYVCELGNHLDTTHDVGFSETFHQYQHAVEGQLTFMTRLS